MNRDLKKNVYRVLKAFGVIVDEIIGDLPEVSASSETVFDVAKRENSRFADRIEIDASTRGVRIFDGCFTQWLYRVAVVDGEQWAFRCDWDEPWLETREYVWGRESVAGKRIAL